MKKSQNKLVKSKDCLKKYGKPNLAFEYAFMTLWQVPKYLTDAIPALPNRIYLNKDLLMPLHKALDNVLERDLCNEIKTWDGCFNIRKAKESKSWSLHSWAIAIDINAAWNGWRQEPQMSKELVKCFVDAGFTWGGKWKKKDGMHFQLSII